MQSSETNFPEIFSKYEKPIFNYILRMVRDRADAEDLTQEFFVKVHQNLPDFRGESKLSTWLYRMATNLCLDHFRKRSYLQKKKTDSLEFPVLNESDMSTASEALEDKEALPPDEAAIKSDADAWFKYFIDQLPEDYRTVFILSELQELKNREIAEILDSSLETVKIRRHRARKRLRELLGACCTFYYDENDKISWDEK